MRIAHILRKYNPTEWGGTETAIERLLDGLRAHQAEVVLYCPKRAEQFSRDPLVEAGHVVKRFRAFLPVWGLSADQQRQLISTGGNLMSLDLMWKLRREPALSIIHTHTLNRLGGIASSIARFRRIPLVVTIHGGVLDLPAAVRAKLVEPLQGGVEWGKVLGWLLRSRRVLDDADAIITCNRTEAALLQQRYPDKIIFVQPHGVPARQFEENQRAAPRKAWPEILGKTLLLAVGRIDPVKNQTWLVQQMPRVLRQHPKAHLVIAGACTDEAYGKVLKKEIRNLGLEPNVTLTGGLSPGDPELIGLFQEAAVVVLPSLSETFGLVILESWAAGTPVLSSRTSGAADLIRESQNGWFFDLDAPESFHARLRQVLDDPEQARQAGESGRRRVRDEFDCRALAGRVKYLYEELIGDS